MHANSSLVEHFQKEAVFPFDVEAPCDGVLPPLGLSYFTMVMSLVLMLVIVPGNLVLIVTVIKDPLRKLRTPFMYFIVNLAVSDLVVGFVTMPLSFMDHFLETKNRKLEIHVLIIRMSYFISGICSMLNFVALLLDRYCYVAYPDSYLHRLSPVVCLLVAVCNWLLAVALSMFYWIVGYVDFLFWYAHVAIAVVLITSALVCTIPGVMRRHATSTRVTLSASLDEGNSAREALISNTFEKARRIVTKAFLALLFLFLGCYAPAIVMMYTLMLCPSCNCVVRNVLRHLTFLFIMSVSAWNPFVCAYGLKSVRSSICALRSKRRPTIVRGM